MKIRDLEVIPWLLHTTKMAVRVSPEAGVLVVNVMVTT